MSSSRSRNRLARPSGWSLRARLLMTVVGLLAVVCVIVGVATTTISYRAQIHQLDNRLTAAGTRTSAAFGPPGGGPSTPPSAPVQGPGTVFAHRTSSGFDTADVFDATTGGLRPLSTGQEAVLAKIPANGHPYTRTLPGLGDYRLVATMSGGEEVITGLPMSDVYAARNLLIAIEVGVSLGALLLTAGVGTVIVGRTLRPLRRVAAVASRVAEMPLDRGEVALSVRVPEIDTDPRTEVGQVATALNRMLGNVGAALTARQASEMRVRQFVADASHELRTPLAAIRGYAELTRRMDDQLPENVTYAMRRVESETTRMTGLVEDMLLLARLDAGRPLAHEDVDLTRLVIDMVSDAHVAAPGHRWLLDVAEAPVIIAGDEARLHQVLANLLANARTHTPPGTTITTSLAVVDGRARITVDDDGPGIPPHLLPEVFDRFARGDTSRSRAAGSTGLGLSIVSAVIDAHGGDVEVASRPGNTRFTVYVPIGVETEQPARIAVPV
jgi:two-component system, OmpR family, sensor kinase